jgi:hypothetical protein
MGCILRKLIAGVREIGLGQRCPQQLEQRSLEIGDLRDYYTDYVNEDCSPRVA